MSPNSSNVPRHVHMKMIHFTSFNSKKNFSPILFCTVCRLGQSKVFFSEMQPISYSIESNGTNGSFGLVQPFILNYSNQQKSQWLQEEKHTQKGSASNKLWTNKKNPLKSSGFQATFPAGCRPSIGSFTKRSLGRRCDGVSSRFSPKSMPPTKATWRSKTTDFM